MNEKMFFTKLNNGWDAEPNAPMPEVEIIDSGSAIKLSFYLNSFIHKDVNEGDKGILIFAKCHMYRLGPTNDEGFYSGQCRFSKTGIKWGDFYLLRDSRWRTDFPEDQIIINHNIINSLNLNHYLFYFRDETFECLAESYSYQIEKE